MAYLHVRATVEDYDDWKADFEGYHSRRAEHGGKNYQLFRSADDPDDVVVLIEFDEVANARAWNDYLVGEGELAEPGMADVEVTYLDLIEQKHLSPA